MTFHKVHKILKCFINFRLKEVFGDTYREVEKFDLTSLVYLEAVIKESMRILPIAPIMARNVDRNLKLSKDDFYIIYP